MIKFLLAGEVKMNITIDDITLRSNLRTKKTNRFGKNTFFKTTLGFIQPRCGPFSDFEGFIQITQGTYKSNKPVTLTGVAKVHLKCDCNNGPIVNGAREQILYSLGLTSPPVYKISKEPEIKLFKKINESVLFHITFYLEDGDQKPVDFNGEKISFNCQLVKIKSFN